MARYFLTMLHDPHSKLSLTLHGMASSDLGFTLKNWTVTCMDRSKGSNLYNVELLARKSRSAETSKLVAHLRMAPFLPVPHISLWRITLDNLAQILQHVTSVKVISGDGVEQILATIWRVPGLIL